MELLQSERYSDNCHNYQKKASLSGGSFEIIFLYQAVLKILLLQLPLYSASDTGCRYRDRRQR
jgi:hypothetical protein